MAWAEWAEWEAKHPKKQQFGRVKPGEVVIK
jgi:hypothetical protein